MRVTVLGKSPSWQDAAGACSGYLVQEDGYALLLECGSGVFGKLRRIVDYVDVHAVVISHLHADHCFDLIPFGMALSYGPRRLRAAGGDDPVEPARPRRPARPRLYVPPGATSVLRELARCCRADGLIDEAFATAEYAADEVLALGPLAVGFCEVPHFIAAYAVELATVDAGPAGRRFTFGADCAPNDRLVAFARDTDVLMVEATLPPTDPGGSPGHLTAREAGEHGRRAAARRLVLTHYSDEMDAEWARREAVDGYGGPVELAREGAVYSL